MPLCHVDQKGATRFVDTKLINASANGMMQWMSRTAPEMSGSIQATRESENGNTRSDGGGWIRKPLSCITLCAREPLHIPVRFCPILKLPVLLHETYRRKEQIQKDLNGNRQELAYSKARTPLTGGGRMNTAMLMIGVMTASTAIPCLEYVAPLQHGRVYSMESALLGTTQRVTIGLPESYGTTDLQYPLLLILDGDLYFDMAYSAASALSACGGMPEVIVVGLETADPAK